MQSKLSQPNDSGSLSKRVFTDMIYHEVMQMDTDTWWDYQAQTLQHLMQFKQAYRQKHSASPAAQMFAQHSSSPAAKMFAQHSSSPAAQMFAPASGPSPQALMSYAPSSSVPAPIPPPATFQR